MKSRLLALAAPAVLALLVACTPSAPPAAAPPAIDTAAFVSAYRAWVLGEADAFVVKAEAFANAVLEGNRKQAQELYAPSRVHFERIEPVAEALGDFDPRIDAREGDVAAEAWGGYHRLEKALWLGEDLKAVAPVAQALVADVRLLRAQLETADLTVAMMVTGSVELLNEVSSSKVTGEEERYSHTDLWDFSANVEGARQIWQILSPPVKTADLELAQTLDTRFQALTNLLEAQRPQGLFRAYGDLSADQIKTLATAVDALAEPLAQLGKHFPTE